MTPRRAFPVVALAFALAPVASAEEAVFTLDPAASYFIAGGTIDGRTLGEQTPGSNRTAITGDLAIDIDRVANTISIVNESATLLPQALPQRPGWDTTDPSPSVFGLAAGPAGDRLLANIESLRPEIGLDDAPLNGGTPSVPN